MSRRKQLILLGLLILALLVSIILIVLRFTGTQPEPVVTPSSNQVTVIEEPTPSLSAEEVQKEQAARTKTSSVQSLSKSFVERYGSFSTEANYQNLRDVLPLMTASFAAETEAAIARAAAPTEYYGITTKVITVSVEEADEAGGTATVRVSTQREEAKGSPGNVSVRYQSIVLTMQKVSSEWRVASATWK